MAVLMGRPVRDKILTARVTDDALTYRAGTYRAFNRVVQRVRIGIKYAIGKELYKVVISNRGGHIMTVERITIEQFGEKVLQSEGLLGVGYFQEGWDGVNKHFHEEFDALATLFEKYRVRFVSVEGRSREAFGRYPAPTISIIPKLYLFLKGKKVDSFCETIDKGRRTDAEWQCLLDPYLRREFARDGAQ